MFMFTNNIIKHIMLMFSWQMLLSKVMYNTEIKFLAKMY